MHIFIINQKLHCTSPRQSNLFTGWVRKRLWWFPQSFHQLTTLLDTHTRYCQLHDHPVESAVGYYSNTNLPRFLYFLYSSPAIQVCKLIIMQCLYAWSDIKWCIMIMCMWETGEKNCLLLQLYNNLIVWEIIIIGSICRVMIMSY